MALEDPRNGSAGGSVQVLSEDFSILYSLDNNQSGEGMTMTEWSEKLNLSMCKTRKIIKKAVLSGIMKVSQKVVDPDWDMRTRTYATYIIIPKENSV